MAPRILVVDDDASARSALRGLLTTAGYEVAVAGDGFKALAVVEELEPMLVVSDLRLPGIDGIALIRRLRERDPRAAIVIVTATDQARSAVTALRAGAADYLCKPLDADQLLAVAERAIEHRRLALEASSLRYYLSAKGELEPLVGSGVRLRAA